MPRKLNGRRWQEEIEIELQDGSVKTLIVKELMGDDRDEFLTYQGNKVKFDKKGNPTGVRDARGTAVKLLALALFEPGSAASLTETQVRELKMPSRIETELVELISLQSGLFKADKEDDNPNS